MIEFDPSLVCNIKCLAVKKNQTVAATTRFFSRKMLMFAKLSLKSFVYEFAKIFFFPSNKTKAIYNKYMTKRVFSYSVLTDTDSVCFFFILICKPESNTPDREVLFEVICENKILHRFDTSHKFWENSLHQKYTSQEKIRLLCCRKHWWSLQYNHCS